MSPSVPAPRPCLPFRSSPLTAFRWMVLAQACFAGMNVCTRLGARDLPWPEIGAARFLIGALMALALARYRGTSIVITDQPSAWRRSVFGAMSAIATFYALASSHIALGDAATLGATAPIFVALLSAPVLGERVGGRVSIAILLGFTGILAVVGPSFALAAPVAGVATLGAMFYALAMIWLRKIGPAETHEAVVLHFSLVALVPMLALALPVWHWPPGARGAALLVGAGLTGGVAQIAMTRAYSLYRAAPLTALSALGIVLTHLLAIPVFGDRPTRWQMMGSLLVIAASLLLAAGREPAPAPARSNG